MNTHRERPMERWKDILFFDHLVVGKGGATLAVKRIGANLHVGAAFCSPHDQYSKNKGRKIAADRARSMGRSCFQMEPLTTENAPELVVQVRLMFARWISEDRRLPGWTRGSLAVRARRGETRKPTDAITPRVQAATEAAAHALAHDPDVLGCLTVVCVKGKDGGYGATIGTVCTEEFRRFLYAAAHDMTAPGEHADTHEVVPSTGPKTLPS